MTSITGQKRLTRLQQQVRSRKQSIYGYLLTIGSWGIIMSIGVSAVLGWFLILGLLFSIQDYEATLASETGQPVAQIFLDAVGKDGAIGLMVVVVVAMFFCG